MTAPLLKVENLQTHLHLRRGVVKASITGSVWVMLAVGRGIRKAIFRR